MGLTFLFPWTAVDLNDDRLDGNRLDGDCLNGHRFHVDLFTYLSGSYLA